MKRRFPHKTNVLLVNITRLGDMLQATPTIAGMKMENPDCKVTVVVEKQFEAVCKIIPHVDEVLSIDLGMTVRSLAREGEGIIDAYEYVNEFVDQLRSKNFDYCLNMSSSAYTAMLLNILGIPRNGGWSSDDEGYRVIESEWARLFATSVFHQNRQYNSLNLVDVFRCSADVEKHPQNLVLDVLPEKLAWAKEMIASAKFTNTGPLIAIQAGASQEKRQWAPKQFIELVRVLVNEHNARIILVGTAKELKVIDPIKAGVNSDNAFVAAGKTTIPELAAILKCSDILVTGDTGPMHMSVAVGTPVVSMFLASAFGFETGPYSPGNLVLQPVIGCGPCNPNKPCLTLDCHEHINPTALAKLVALRLQGDVQHIPDGWFDPKKIIVYKTTFDRYGFYDLQALTPTSFDPLKRYRDAYRKMWLSDLAGFETEAETKPKPSLRTLDDGIEGLSQAVHLAEEGESLIKRLTDLITDTSSPTKHLQEVNSALSELDRRIEELGFKTAALGPLTRMFVFAKENLSGSDPLSLASQMGGVYSDFKRRGVLLGHYLN